MGWWFMIVSAILLWGCQADKQTDLYYILMAKTPRLTDQSIYAYGHPIGRLQSKKVGFNAICELAVSIEPGFREQLSSTAVFYARGGQLHFAQLAPAVTPIAKGGRMLGFSSINAFRWYRLKHMLGSPDATVAAERLYARMQWQTPVNHPL